MRLRIGLAYDLQPAQLTNDRWAEWDRPETVDALEAALRALGHEVIRLGSAHDWLTRHAALRSAVDLVFSVAEGQASRTREAWVPTLCELLDIPYVGSRPATLALALDKWMTRRVWAADGLPVPWGCCVNPGAPAPRVPRERFPVIVKPRYEGSGIGIDCRAIVDDPAALAERVAWVTATYDQPALVEQFVRGGEFTVALLGDPLAALPPVQRHVDARTTLSCHLVDASVPPADGWQLPVTVTPSLEAHLGDLAARAARVVGCRDLARVDIRVTPDGRPFLLEINPLPSLDAESSFALLADVLGWGFPGLLERIVTPAIRRTAHFA